jgi:glycosyltransferase involved in cell wall biosynthesis
MKIAVFFTYGVSLSTWDRVGLIEREVILYEKLVKCGNEVTFITYGGISDLKYTERLNGIKVLPIYSIFKKSKFKVVNILMSFILPFRLRKRIANFDILKTKQMHGAWTPAILSKLTRIPLLYRYGYDHLYFFRKQNRSGLIYALLRKLVILALKQASYVVVSSNQDRDRSLLYYPGIQNITVQQNWIDLDFFKNNNSVRELTKLLVVGRLIEQKNLFMLLDSVIGLNVELNIIGDGYLKNDLIEHAKKNSIKVNFIGKIPNSELPKYYNEHEIYLLVSEYEGNPKTLIEAMACGCSVIGTDVVGINSIITNYDNGILTELSSQSIKNAIIELLNNEELRVKISMSARKHVVRHNSLNAYIKKELDIYSEINQHHKG